MIMFEAISFFIGTGPMTGMVLFGLCWWLGL